MSRSITILFLWTQFLGFLYFKLEAEHIKFWILGVHPHVVQGFIYNEQ